MLHAQGNICGDDMCLGELGKYWEANIIGNVAILNPVSMGKANAIIRICKKCGQINIVDWIELPDF